MPVTLYHAVVPDSLVPRVGMWDSAEKTRQIKRSARLRM